MEKMEAPLSDVPRLLKRCSSPSTSKLRFGIIAARLLEIVQSIHAHKHLVIDMKSENFMLASVDSKSKKQTKGVAEQLASRLRLLDLALAQGLRDGIGEHRPNEGGCDLAGTPLYASLNVHEGNKPSRRDDLESLGYVIAELLIQINSQSDKAGVLPWSTGKSDGEVGELKKAQVRDPRSKFYSQIGDAKVASVFREYMDKVTSYSYKQNPDYDALSKILLNLDVTPRSAPKKAAKKPPPQTTRAKATASSGTKRMTRSRGGAADGASPSKVARTNPSMDSDSDDEFFEAAQDDGVAEMDWEPTRDENLDPSEDERKPSATTVGVLVCVDDGPDAGLATELVMGSAESVVVGSNPKSKGNESALVLSGDPQVDPSHVRLSLGVTKKRVTVTITDLNSSGTFLGTERIRKGKDYVVFPGQSFRIGESSISIKKSTSKSNPTSAKPFVIDVDEDSEESPALPRLKRRGFILQVTEGPHKGESFELESGGVETLVIGSKPSKGAKGSKDVGLMKLAKDKEVGASQVRVELAASKKLTAVIVTDLKSTGTTDVNGDRVQKGKAAKAFVNDRIVIGETELTVKAL